MYLWPLLSLLGRLARSSCRKWPSNLYMQFFPFRKKTHVNPNFVVFKPANREFGLMQTTPVYHIRMPSWPPKRHTADNMSKPKKNVFDFGNAFAVALVLCEFFFVSTVLRRRNQGTSSACLLAYWVG